MSPERNVQRPDEPGTEPARGAEEEHSAGAALWPEAAEGAGVDVGDDEPPAP